MDSRLRGNDGHASYKGSGVNFFTRSKAGIHLSSWNKLLYGSPPSRGRRRGGFEPRSPCQRKHWGDPVPEMRKRISGMTAEELFHRILYPGNRLKRRSGLCPERASTKRLS